MRPIDRWANKTWTSQAALRTRDGYTPLNSSLESAELESKKSVRLTKTYFSRNVCRSLIQLRMSLVVRNSETGELQHDTQRPNPYIFHKAISQNTKVHFIRAALRLFVRTMYLVLIPLGSACRASGPGLH